MIPLRLSALNPIGKLSTVSLIIVFSVGMSVGMPATAFAKTANKPTPDVRIIIDISGSMKQNDPKNLRIPALNLLIDLLPQNSKAGVWTFGKYVNMLIKHDFVNDGWKNNAKVQANKINSVALYTNIGEALDIATVGWLEPDPRYDRSIILLTDGMVDVSKSDIENAKEKNRILKQIVPRLSRANVAIHAVALSKNADRSLLEQLSVRSDGLFAIANSANDLMKIFLTAFDSAVPSEQVPLEDNKFKIDSSVEEFTALVFRASPMPTELVSPVKVVFSKRTTHKHLTWLSTDDYDLITLKNPTPGDWQLKADIDPASRVSIISDLSLHVDRLPKNIVAGEKLTMNIKLENKNEIIKDIDFLKLVAVHISQKQIGGKDWSATLGGEQQKGAKSPGHFVAKFGKTIVPGDHDFTVIADGKTFQRKISQSVKVFENLVTVNAQEIGEDENKQFSIEVIPQAEIINTKNTEVLIDVRGADGSHQNYQAQWNEVGQWEFSYSPELGPGDYEFMVEIQGQTLTEREIQVKRGPFKYQLLAPEAEATEELALENEFGEQDISTDDPASETPEVEASQPEQTVEEIVDSGSGVETQAALETDPEGEEVTADAAEQDAEEFQLFNLDLTTLIALLLGGNLGLAGLGYGIYKFVKRKKNNQDENENKNTDAPENKTASADDAEAAPEPEAEVDDDATVLASVGQQMDDLMDDSLADSPSPDSTADADINDSLLALDEDDDDEDMDDMSDATVVADDLMDLEGDLGDEMGDLDLGDDDGGSANDEDDSLADVDDLLDLDDDEMDEAL